MLIVQIRRKSSSTEEEMMMMALYTSPRRLPVLLGIAVMALGIGIAAAMLG